MTQRTIKASAPGKIHFIGEHTAVYGKPAILAAIEKRCYVELTPTENSTVQITAKNFDKSLTVSFEEIETITEKAQDQWEQYREKKDISLLRAIIPDDALYPVIAIGETLKFFGEHPKHGFDLHIDSQIPIGSGLGSSAAVAASIVGAVSSFLGQNVDKKVLGNIAIKVEQKKHGNPSYGDVGAVMNGGLIWFQKKSPEEIIVKPLDFEVSKKISDNLFIIQSGIPEESTGEMVHNVSLVKKENPDRFQVILDDQEHLTNQLLTGIKKGDESIVLRSIEEGERNLEEIGVVSESAKALIREIENAGGAAKICGAGGKSKGGGIVLAYHENTTVLKTLANSRGLTYYTVQIGATGLVIG